MSRFIKISFIIWLLLNNQFVFAQMNGNYTIGLNGICDFKTINQAVDSLKSKGINGQVVFKIKAGKYNEQIVIPPINGSSYLNTITFQSENKDSSSVEISFLPQTSIMNFTLQLQGCDFVVFQYLTFTTKGSSLAKIIEINYQSCNNQFIHNRIIGTAPPFDSYSNSSDISLIYSPSILTSNDTSNVFQSNYFSGGYYAFYYCGTKISKPETGTRILNNYFLNQVGASIYLQFGDQAEISGNTIENNYTSFFGGINVTFCTNNILINSNNIKATNSFSGYGIYLESLTKKQKYASLISNNFIRIHTDDTISSTYFYSYGIGSDFIDSLIIVHNSICITGRLNTSSAVWFGLKTNNIHLENNILTNFASGYSICCLDSLNPSFYSGNNCFFTDQPNCVQIAKTNFKFIDWINFLKSDSSSIFCNPDFLNPENLHTFSAFLNGKAKILSYIGWDIDNEKRNSSNPDIGADEFEPLKIDICLNKILYPSSSINCNLTATEYPSILLINKGTQPQTNTKIELNLYGKVKLLETITDTINSGDSLVYYLKSPIDLSIPGVFKIFVSISDTSDLNSYNDTAFLSGRNILPISKFPFLEDFEKKDTVSFFLLANNQSFINIDTFSSFTGKFGLHFQGRCQNIGWVGGNTTTSFNAWNDNISHQSEAFTCLVDGRNLKHLRVCFRLKQTFSYNLNRSWFHVLINDSIKIADLNGKKDFNPVSNNDSFALVTFDLDSFAGTLFKIKFQASCLTSYKYYQNGDNVFIDDVLFFVPPKNDIGISAISLPPGNSCGEVSTPVILTVNNFGYEPQQSFLINCEVKTPSGIIFLQDTFRRKIYPLKSDTFTIGSIETMKAGYYYFKAFPDFTNDSDCNQNDTAFLYIRFFEIKKLPIIETFEGYDSLTNWKIKNMWVSYPGHHQLNSYSLSNSIWAEDTISYAFYKRKTDVLSSQSYLLFNYRIISNQFPFYGALLSNRDTLLALISDNCGRSWDTIFSLDAIQHQSSDFFKKIKIPLANYANKEILFGFYFRSDSFNLNYLDIDSIVIMNLPYLKITHDTGLCEGSKIILSPIITDTNLKFIWQDGISLDTLSFQKQFLVDTAGTYLLVIIDSLGWKNYDTVHVAFYPNAIPEIEAINKVCYGESLYLKAKNCQKYLWSTADTSGFIKSQIYSDTIFYLNGWNQYNCYGRDSIEIKMLPLPSVITIEDTNICTGNQIILHATGGLKYLWNTGDTSSQLSILVDKSIKLIVKGTDSLGCSNFDSVNIRAIPLPEPDLGKDTLICAWKSILLNPGNFEEYYWWNGITDSIVTVDSSSVGLDTLFAWVKVGTNNCFQTDSIQIVFDKCISVNENSIINSISVFPNPVTDELSIQIPENIYSEIHLRLLSTNGKTIFNRNFENINNVFKIDLKNISQGSYLLHLSNSQINYYKLLIIIH